MKKVIKIIDCELFHMKPQRNLKRRKDGLSFYPGRILLHHEQAYGWVLTDLTVFFSH